MTINSRFNRQFIRQHMIYLGRSLVVVGVFALLGILTLHASHAATYATAAEAESGTVSGNASIVSDSSASGGSAVKFGMGSGSSGTCQKVVLPAYWYPDSGWTTAINSMPSGSFLILDISGSGAGSAKDPAFVSYVQAAQAKGIKVLGYSDTTYGARSISTVETDVQNYKAWYGVTDMFLDQESNSTADLSYYQTLYNYIHSYDPGSTVMLNPGTYPPEQYTTVSDVLMVYEDTYANYPGASVPSWVSNYPASHFVNTVHDTSSAQMANALSLSRSRNAGYVFVTDGTGGNPYSSLPSYWSAELANIAAACS
jgi:Spherulation-specific family 4